ncbi:hypothetical protein ACQCSX_15955 [Pseudarthrobacter sp. P1]|uniref:hypothetical protein n=1 Tax=Pseudarthrobacter sp. P1 TaxID=3418418 RepID=UPI003CF25597
MPIVLHTPENQAGNSRALPLAKIRRGWTGRILVVLAAAHLAAGLLPLAAASAGTAALAEPAALAWPAAEAPHPSVKAVDSANAITDPGWFTRAYADGFRLYVAQSTQWTSCAPWDHLQPQLKMALDAGLKIAVYTRDPRCWQAGIAAAGPYASRLQFFALDVETGGVAVTRGMVDGVAATGVRPVIYTGATMWPTLQGASANSFPDIPLWDTDTSVFPFSGWAPDYLAPTPIPYGGWNTPTTMRIASQQQFEFNYNGVAVDLNSFDVSFLKVP